MPDPQLDVSVLVLAYNHAPYIAACLDSLLAQDFGGRVEILIGEDCSTDATAEIVGSYAQQHPQIQVISSPSNVGMFVNHRRLLSAATGRFVAYCEGDDYWHERTKLSRQVDFLDRHPELAGVYSDVDHLITRGAGWARLPRYWSTFLGPQPTVTTFEDLLVRNTVQTCSVLLRGDTARSFIHSALATGQYAVDDWPLFLHMTQHDPLGRLGESLATYRRVPGSVTNSGAANNERRLMDQFRLINDASSLVPHTSHARVAGVKATKQALAANALTDGDREMLRRAIGAGATWDVPSTSRDRGLMILLALPLVPGLIRRFHRIRRRVAEMVRYR